MKTKETGSLFNMTPDDRLWLSMLSLFGISVKPSSDKVFMNEVVAFGGQSIKCLTKGQLEDLFANNFVLLDGGAVASLADMGLLGLAGIKKIRIHKAPTKFNSYEQITDGKIYGGFAKAKIPVDMVGDSVEIEYAGEVEIISSMINEMREVSAPCMTVSENCFVMPYIPNFEHTPPNMHTLARQSALREVLKRRGIPTALGGAAISLLKFDTAFIVTNAVQDDREDVELFLPGVSAESIFEIDRSGKKIKADAFRNEDGNIVLRGIFPRISNRTFVIYE